MPQPQILPQKLDKKSVFSPYCKIKQPHPMSELYGMFALPKQPLSPKRKARTRFPFQRLTKQGFDNSQNLEGGRGRGVIQYITI